jgi:hypothetical protein
MSPHPSAILMLRDRAAPRAPRPRAIKRVQELGGWVIHPGERWAVCRDSEGSPCALQAVPEP